MEFKIIQALELTETNYKLGNKGVKIYQNKNGVYFGMCDTLGNPRDWAAIAFVEPDFTYIPVEFLTNKGLTEDYIKHNLLPWAFV